VREIAALVDPELSFPAPYRSRLVPGESGFVGAVGHADADAVFPRDAPRRLRRTAARVRVGHAGVVVRRFADHRESERVVRLLDAFGARLDVGIGGETHIWGAHPGRGGR